MTGGAEGGHGVTGAPGKDMGCGPHGAAHEYRLANLGQRRRQRRVPWAKRARGAEVSPSRVRSDGRTGQFPIRERDALPGRFEHHAAQEFAADLAPQAARAAVNADHHLAGRQPERLRRRGIEHLADLLDLQMVIAGAEGAHFVALAVLGLLRDPIRQGAGHAAAFLDAREIIGLAIALGERPDRAAGQYGIQRGGVQMQGAAAAEPGGNGREQRIGESCLDRLQFGTREAGAQQTPPQEISKPTPPADSTPPSSGSNAATPPIGNP